MKRILVDGTYLGMQMKGVGRYTANTLRHLAELDSVNEYNVLVRRNTPLPPLPQNDRFHYIPIHLHNHYLHGGWTLPQQAKRLRADIAWIPYETTLGILPCPYLVVCHDVPRLITQAQNIAGNRLSISRRALNTLDSFWLRCSLRHAAIVFANSHFVGAWLRDDLHIPAERVRYAPCAPGADFATLAQAVDRQAVRRQLACAAGYVLVFATGDRRENLATVLRVFDALVAQGSALNLVITGVRQDDAAHIRAQINPYAWRERVRLLPFYGEDQMVNLAEVYASASVYLDLSLHEGFGMQVIEAMACGTPVVCSNRGALPEVAGEAAMLVEPTKEEEIIKAILSIISNRDLCQRLVILGFDQAMRFNWHNTAVQVLDGLHFSFEKRR